jgi:hypothetical protein|tara:strand:+ start:832 stop:1002 length:171 start_codon:yes stop_codon:yes gene_type:complete
MPSFYDSTKKKPKKSKKVKGYKKGGGVFLSSGAPIPKKSVARGSGAARTQYFRKNG